MWRTALVLLLIFLGGFIGFLFGAIPNGEWGLGIVMMFAGVVVAVPIIAALTHFDVGRDHYKSSRPWRGAGFSSRSGGPTSGGVRIRR